MDYTAFFLGSLLSAKFFRAFSYEGIIVVRCSAVNLQHGEIFREIFTMHKHQHLIDHKHHNYVVPT